MIQNAKKLTFKELKKYIKNNAYYNNPNAFGEESVDHINISLQSNTKLGKILDPSYLKVINYKHAGKFNSVLSLWYWLKTDNLDDNIRRLTGVKLKKYAEADNSFNKYVPNFKAIIANATWLKLKSYHNLIKEIKELDPNIKFLSYYVIKSSNLRVCTSYASLIIDIADEIVAAIREDREPDFDKFVDDETKTGLMYLEGVLSKVLPEEKIKELIENEKNAKKDESNDDKDEPNENVESVEENVANEERKELSENEEDAEEDYSNMFRGCAF